MLLQKDSHVLLFIKDCILQYNTCRGDQQIIKIPEPVGDPTQTKDARATNRKCLCARFSTNGELLGIILDNKQMVIYDTDFKVLCNVITKRSCSNLRFTHKNDVVVADKTGDVYLYDLKKFDVPILLLGHLSMLLDVAITNCGKFLITSDRDEKIRVSCFPNCYNIMSYCLGHSEFVTNLEISGKILISASGDGTVRMWDYLNGKQLSIINTNDYIQNKNIIDKFSKEMDNENVDAQALPIVDMQIYERMENSILLGITLLDYNGIQTYDMEVSPSMEINAQFNETIKVDSKILAFSLSSQLIILTYDNLYLYNLDNRYFVKMHSVSLNQICNHNYLDMKDVTYCDYNISSLYKRKYDNVQEYLEKKKVRLGNL